jgi:hypothetical protein
MKRNTAIFILLIAMLAQVGSKWLVVLSYEWNKAYIAENLCENQVRIPMCNGTCYLGKQLREDNSKTPSKAPIAIQVQMSEFLIHSAPNFPVWQVLSALQTNQKPVTPCQLLPQTTHGAIFHPPLAFA